MNIANTLIPITKTIIPKSANSADVIIPCTMEIKRHKQSRPLKNWIPTLEIFLICVLGKKFIIQNGSQSKEMKKSIRAIIFIVSPIKPIEIE